MILSEKKVAAEKEKSAVSLARAVTKASTKEKKVLEKEKQGNLRALAHLEKY